ncbi:MAG: NADH:flavin oxidoreductase/NADH oxidase family protein [Bacteroidetes bacterium]|nr:MAG: NADH:flavin oxidoreductase/NADH oxidase family protein [Bacteroidota bacterium]
MGLLNTPFKLPNGTILKNRIAKSAMSENLANGDHSPSKEIIHAYKRWADGGLGLNITGNVMVDSRALNAPGNVVIEDRKHLDLLKKWTSTVLQDSDSHLWTQINHSGRQSTPGISTQIIAPSAVPLNIKGGSLLFKAPRAMTEDEILEQIDRYANTAEISKEAGFTGVQIHGAHGYLVSQFLSPITNKRKDQWGGNLENRARFVVSIYNEMRKRVGPDFPIGIKINSADFQRGGFTEEESMEVVSILSSLNIDLIEVSGGTYEKAAMMGAAKKQSTREREAYFLDYVEKVRQKTSTPLMLTGGFRTVAGMEDALQAGHLDIIGLARPFSMFPDLANRIFSGELTELNVPTAKTGFKAIDRMGFVDIMWHEVQIKRLGQGLKPDPNLSAWIAMANNFGGTLGKLLPGIPFLSGRSRGF